MTHDGSFAFHWLNANCIEHAHYNISSLLHYVMLSSSSQKNSVISFFNTKKSHVSGRFNSEKIRTQPMEFYSILDASLRCDVIMLII